MRNPPDDRQSSAEKEEELEELFLRQAESLHGFVSAMLGFAAEAEDLAQEVLLEGLRSFSRFDAERASFRTWLFSIARWRIKDELRRRGKGPGLQSLSEADLSSPARASDSEFHSLLDRAFAELSEDQRSAFCLVHMQGFTLREAAGIEGAPEGTIKSRIARARESLKRNLEGTRT